METTFSNKCRILGQLWSEYSQDPEFRDFVEFNDLGLPLAYLTSEKLAEPSTDGQRYIEETWVLFLGSLGIEDTGFESIEELFDSSLNGQ